MEPASEILMHFPTCFILFHYFSLKKASIYLFHFTFTELLAIFYQSTQRHPIGYLNHCRRKDRRSFKLIVDRELRRTTLKLSSIAFEE